MIGLLKTNLPKKQGGVGDFAVAVTTLDLLQILLPYFSPTDASSLFDSCLSAEVLNARDNGIQKRGYKILTKLVEQKKLASLDAEAVLVKLDTLADGLAPAAKKVRSITLRSRLLSDFDAFQDRFNLLSTMIPAIPSTSLHLLVSLIPEAVLGTKEPSDKARSAAFELILSMGRRMKEGGVVKRSMIDGMEEDDAAEDCKFEPYFARNHQLTWIYDSHCCYCAGVHDYDCWWSCGCKPPYDQCYGNCSFTTCI